MRRLILLPVVVVLLTGATIISENRTISATSHGRGSGILSPDRDASTNWQMAGLLSVGAIPKRTTICATVALLDLVKMTRPISRTPSISASLGK